MVWVAANVTSSVRASASSAMDVGEAVRGDDVELVPSLHAQYDKAIVGAVGHQYAAAAQRDDVADGIVEVDDTRAVERRCAGTREIGRDARDSFADRDRRAPVGHGATGRTRVAPGRARLEHARRGRHMRPSTATERHGAHPRRRRSPSIRLQCRTPRRQRRGRALARLNGHDSRHGPCWPQEFSLGTRRRCLFRGAALRDELASWTPPRPVLSPVIRAASARQRLSTQALRRPPGPPTTAAQRSMAGQSAFVVHGTSQCRAVVKLAGRMELPLVETLRERPTQLG